MAAMHPIVKRFCERRPRTYGVLLVVSGILLNAARSILEGPLEFVIFSIALLSVSTGMIYIAIGPYCNKWKATFYASYDPDALTWWQIVALTAFGIGFLCVSLLLHSAFTH